MEFPRREVTVNFKLKRDGLPIVPHNLRVLLIVVVIDSARRKVNMLKLHTWFICGYMKHQAIYSTELNTIGHQNDFLYFLFINKDKRNIYYFSSYDF